jgi:hypothetical protein
MPLSRRVYPRNWILSDRGISHVQNAPDEIKIEDIPELLIKHKKKHGQDLPTALVQQGLVMAMWISQNKT